MVVDSDVTPLPETPQSPPALPLSKTHQVKGIHEDTFPSRTIEPHWRASSPDSSVPPEVRAPYRHSSHEILRVFTIHHDATQIYIERPTPPREFDGSYDIHQDDECQSRRQVTMEMQPDRSPNRELSPILHALTGHEAAVVQDISDTENRLPSPTLPYGSPDSPWLNGLADLADLSPRARSTSVSTLWDTNFTDSLAGALRMLTGHHQDLSSLGLQLETSTIPLATHASTDGPRSWDVFDRVPVSEVRSSPL